jgi:hypothetical protein
MVLSPGKKDEIEKAVKFWVDRGLSTDNIEDARIVRLYMPVEEYENKWKDEDGKWKKDKLDSFLVENETYKPSLPSLKDIAANALKKSDNYPEIKKQIKNNQPIEIRELFFEKKKSKEKKPRASTSLEAPDDSDNIIKNKK